MSQFEFVSVALALVYSFAAARLLAALPWVLHAERRYWVHTTWFAVVMLALVVTWWGVWSLREVAWNSVRFIWALSIPAMIYLRAGVLVSQDPESETSWRDYYYRTRVPFFGIGVAIAVNAGLVPWVMGVVAWLEPAPAHTASAALLVLYSIALVTKRPAVHAMLAVINFVLLLLAIVFRALDEAGAS